MYKLQPKTAFFGKNIIYLPSCHSTNDFAAQILQEQEISEGTIIITPDQTAGRGQRGNTWESNVGENLTVSIVLKPVFLTAMQQFQLNMAVSVGIQQGLEVYFGDDLRIKWSNDVFVGNQKIGGVLIENTLSGYQITHSIIGIGLNINQEKFADPKATSFKKKLGKTFDIEHILSQLLEKIEYCYLEIKNNGNHILKTNYLNKLFRLNEIHYYECNGKRFLGEIIGISEVGALQIKTENEVLEFGFKEISFVF